MVTPLPTDHCGHAERAALGSFPPGSAAGGLGLDWAHLSMLRSSWERYGRGPSSCSRSSAVPKLWPAVRQRGREQRRTAAPWALSQAGRLGIRGGASVVPPALCPSLPPQAASPVPSTSFFSSAWAMPSTSSRLSSSSWGKGEKVCVA